MILRTGAASSGPCTNDRAIMSARKPTAQRRSCSSFVPSAGTLSLTLGTLRALMVGYHAADEDTGPHAVTSHTRHLDRDPAVIDEDLVTRPDVGRRAGIGGSRLGGVSWHVLASNGELVAC
jgi:hypothetical protein